MHREFSHAELALTPPNAGGLYTFTAILGLLVALDLGPWLITLFPSEWGMPSWSNSVLGFRFALLAAILGGVRVLYGSLDLLLAGRLGADLALGIAIIAAILINEPLVAAEIVLIGLIGECLEHWTFARTQSAIRKLAEVFPIRCWRLTANGNEERIFTHQIQVGDTIRVKPGAKVPADGVIKAGQSAVNNAALTGESEPVEVGPGDSVLAGAINTTGALDITARRVGRQSLAGRVIELTARALREKSQVERSADLLARYFLPVVLGLAVLTLLGNVVYQVTAGRLGFWPALRLSVYPTLSVLVVACPCALILATPAAVVAALGRLAGTGVLVKSGAALEKLAQVQTFAFDKTGTLTEGRFQVCDDPASPAERTAEEANRANLAVSLAATAEAFSDHPLARAVVAHATELGVTKYPGRDFQAEPGRGVRVTTELGEVRVGKPDWIGELTLKQQGELQRRDQDGQTVLAVSLNGQVLGLLGLRDSVRPEAYAVVQELRQLSIARIEMLTGDRASVASAIGSQVGLDHAAVHAGLLPSEKAERVDKTTAFVGDGINDAPALATAGVGLAVGSGPDAVAEAADVVLMGDPLTPLPLLVRLSRETVRIIRQNIVVFGFGANIVGVVLTAWFWPLFSNSAQWYESGPLAAAVYHQISSVLVLLNSMRLLAFERPAGRLLAAPADWLQRLDNWLNSLNPDEWLHELAHRWRTALVVVGGLLGMGWLASGLLALGPDEIAVVKRFGKPLDADLGPGLHWRWPYPIEQVHRLALERVRVTEVGFRSISLNPILTGDASWASGHSADGVRKLAEEAEMITGDGNLVEIQASVRWTVSDPRHFVLEVAEPDALIRCATEAVLRELTAGEAFLALLTSERAAFQQAALQRLTRRLANLDTRGLGVRVEGLSVHDLHPPPEVVPAYHQVAQEMDRRDRQINAAQAEAMAKQREAQSRAAEIVRQAEAAATERRLSAAAARDAFLAIYHTRTRLSAADEAQLAGRYLADMLAGLSEPDARAEYARRRAARLVVQMYLTDFRLSWNALTEVLRGRDKLLIDAENLPGKRNLLLLDPEQLRPPPVVLPARRDEGP